MQQTILSRILGVVLLLPLLLVSGLPHSALAEPQATIDDEIIYIDNNNVLRVIDPNVASGTQEITWSSPDGNWYDFAAGDFNNDGDKEIVVIGNGRLTVFDPVVRDPNIVPDGENNLVPWKRLYERSLPNGLIIGAGNLDSGVPGDEIVVGYGVSEPNGVNYRVDVLKTSDGGRTWTTHISRGFGAPWTYIKVGNINNVGSDDLLLGRTTGETSLVEAHEVDNDFALIFSRVDNSFTQNDGAIGQVYGGGTGEAVLLRTFNATSEVPSMLIYQFLNNAWQTVPEDDAAGKFFPHPFKVVTGDVNASGDDEIFWLRDGPSGNTSTVRLVMINRGTDTLPVFETPLDADNGYRALAMGDPDGDGRKELAVMRNNRIRYFYALESGNNTSLFTDYNLAGTNSRSIQMANLDGSGYTAGARIIASPTSLSMTLEAGTIKNQVLSIQLSNVGSGGNLPIAVAKESGASWYTFSVGTATTPANIFVSQFDASNLDPGTYRDRLKVTSSNPNVLNQPFYISIEMIVTPASFSLSPTSFGVATKKTDPVIASQPIDVRGLPGLTFSAAILSQPEFNAAVSALGTLPSQGRFTPSGALVVGNGSAEFTTSVNQAASNGSRSTSAVEWPSGLPWAFASSAGTIVQDTITVVISPSLMTADAGAGVLIVLGDARAGEFPENLKISSFSVVRTDTPFYLPIIAR